MLRVRNLTQNILKHIDLDLDEGECLIILGANGSGKTTLAKALCHLLPSEGVTYGGKNLSDHRAEWVNYVPSKFKVYDEYLSVIDYLHLNQIGKTTLTPENALELVGLAPMEKRPCAQLSSGESALLMIAGSMLHSSHYTILDEPTANLDQEKKVKVYNLLKNGSYFKSLIVITHDLNLAFRLGYKILYLHQGEVLFYGSSETFFDPSNLEKHFGSYIKSVEGYFMVNYDEAH